MLKIINKLRPKCCPTCGLTKKIENFDKDFKGNKVFYCGACDNYFKQRLIVKNNKWLNKEIKEK